METQKAGAKTLKEIALEYDVDRRTLYRWLKQVEIVLKGGIVTPAEQALIYAKFGDPRQKAKEKR